MSESVSSEIVVRSKKDHMDIIRKQVEEGGAPDLSSPTCCSRRWSADQREQVEYFLRTYMYGDTNARLSYGDLAKMATEQLGFEVTRQQCHAMMKAIVRFDAKAERLWAELPIEKKRAEHRRRRQHVYNLAIRSGNLAAANVALDRLAAMDGLNVETMKIERSIREMTDEELENLIARADGKESRRAAGAGETPEGEGIARVADDL